MGLGKSRRTRVALAVVVVLAVAGAAVGVVALQHKRADDRKAAASRAERRYLDGVRAVAGDVYVSVEPFAQVADSFGIHPYKYDVYETRDAISLPGPAAELDTELSRLKALAHPAPMATAAAGLAKALQQLDHDIAALRALGDVEDGNKLFLAIDSQFVNRLSLDEVAWSDALQAAFTRQHLPIPKVPAGGSAGEASLVMWVFSTDRICDTTYDAVRDSLHRIDSDHATIADLQRTARALTRATAEMRKVALPQAQQARLRHAITDRLVTLDAIANSLDALIGGLHVGDRQRVSTAIQTLNAAVHAVPPLVRGFDAEGVRSCSAMTSWFALTGGGGQGNGGVAT